MLNTRVYIVPVMFMANNACDVYSCSNVIVFYLSTRGALLGPFSRMFGETVSL